jgi:hypothetical protein
MYIGHHNQHRPHRGPDRPKRRLRTLRRGVRPVSSPDAFPWLILREREVLANMHPLAAG